MSPELGFGRNSLQRWRILVITVGAVSGLARKDRWRIELFLPILQHEHFYLLCVDFVSKRVEIIDNSTSTEPTPVKYGDTPENVCSMLIELCSADGFLVGFVSKKPIWAEGHTSKSIKVEEKRKCQKCEMDCGKENDRFKEKYGGKSIQQLDLSNCIQCYYVYL
nr:paired amphipathic helix protein Sin3-like 2 [Ipomoea batatas]GMC53231.1 paired amphipathic helix protein Sin3-like 2 [Ipomoea batatas]